METSALVQLDLLRGLRLAGVGRLGRRQVRLGAVACRGMQDRGIVTVEHDDLRFASWPLGRFA